MKTSGSAICPNKDYQNNKLHTVAGFTDTGTACVNSSSDSMNILEPEDEEHTQEEDSSGSNDDEDSQDEEEEEEEEEDQVLMKTVKLIKEVLFSLILMSAAFS